MNNSDVYGKSIDLVTINKLDLNDYEQQVIKKNILQSELKFIDEDIIKYHHISIVDKNDNIFTILIDTATKNITRMHGKKIVPFKSFSP